MACRTFAGLIGALSLVFPSMAAADDMADMMAKLPPPAFTSDKSSPALELCIGVGISHWGAVSVLHGEKRTLLGVSAGMGGTMAMLVAVDDTGARRSLSMYSSKGWDDRLAGVVRGCL